MQYLIDNKVMFNPNDGLLWLKEEPEVTISLTLTADRLLTYLVQHEGVVISRETLLANVWESYGVSASGSSLNQHISILRGALSRLGITETIIKTVPKVGFITQHVRRIEGIPTTVDLRILNDTSPKGIPSELEESVMDDASSANEVKNALAVSTKKANRKFSSNVWLHTAGLASILLLVFLLNTIEDSKTQAAHASLHPLGEIGICKVYSIYINSDPIKEKKMAIVRDRVQKHNLTCITPESFYIVNISDNMAYGQRGVVFISACTTNKGGQVDSCRDYYEPF